MGTKVSGFMPGKANQTPNKGHNPKKQAKTTPPGRKGGGPYKKQPTM